MRPQVLSIDNSNTNFQTNRTSSISSSSSSSPSPSKEVSKNIKSEKLFCIIRKEKKEKVFIYFYFQIQINVYLKSIVIFLGTSIHIGLHGDLSILRNTIFGF